MASKGAPDCLAKRDLLAAGRTSPEKLIALAEEFLSAGLAYDALRFLAAAGETARITGMAREAVRIGDLFLFLQAQKELGREPDQGDLGELSQAARSRGLTSFADQAQALIDPDGSKTDG